MRNNTSYRFGGVLAAIAMAAMLCATTSTEAAIATLDDITLAGDFNNGDPGGLSAGDSYDGSFTSGGIGFNNSFTQGAGYSFWSGWATSKVNDLTTSGFGNQYAAYDQPLGAGDESSQYGVAFGGSASITAPAGEYFQSMRITNTTYAALSMLNGDSFSKKFGGLTGDDEDFFKIIITGKQAGSSVGTIDFFLADYRFSDNSQDYLLDQWTMVDLTSLVGADSLEFSFASSDEGSFGINTPLYFAADNIVTAVPEPATLALTVAAGLMIVGFSRRKNAIS